MCIWQVWSYIVHVYKFHYLCAYGIINSVLLLVLLHFVCSFLQLSPSPSPHLPSLFFSLIVYCYDGLMSKKHVKYLFNDPSLKKILTWIIIYNNNNNDFISKALFHVKHAQLRCTMPMNNTHTHTHTRARARARIKNILQKNNSI